MSLDTPISTKKFSELEERYKDLVKLIVFSVPDYDEYQLIQQVAHKMRYEDMSEKEALDALQEYFEESKAVKELREF